VALALGAFAVAAAMFLILELNRSFSGHSLAFYTFQRCRSRRRYGFETPPAKPWAGNKNGSGRGMVAFKVKACA
jgi:hypothetical protein